MVFRGVIFSNVILIGLTLLHFIVLVIWLRSRLNAKYQGAVRTGKTDEWCGVNLDKFRVSDIHHMHSGIAWRMMLIKVNQTVNFICTNVVALAQRAHLGSACYALWREVSFQHDAYATNSNNITYFLVWKWQYSKLHPSFEYNKVCLHGTSV